MSNEITLQRLHSRYLAPLCCPSCGSELIIDGVDLRCPNKECGSKQSTALTNFIRKFEIKHTAKKQLDNFGLKTIADLLAFLPNQAYKSEVTFYEELNQKLFSASPQKIFCAMHFRGLAEVQLKKIIDHYSFDWICGLSFTDEEKQKMLLNLPAGIGEKSVEAFWESAADAVKYTQKIVTDARYHWKAELDEVKSNEATPEATKGSICFTGALESMTRSEAQFLATSSGFEVKGGVTKGLTYLVMADPNSTSGKARKARELGTKCISEKEFLEMCKGEVAGLEDL